LGSRSRLTRTVSLARAVYSRASTLILDNVISAVDADTAQHIVQYCFRSPLMAERTVIIASHAIETLAPLASKSVFLEGGRTVWQGHGKELLKSEYMTHLQTSSLSEPAEVVPMLKAESSKTHGDEIEFREAVLKTPKQLIEEEKRAKGNVDLHHWQKLKEFNGSNVWWMGMFVIMILSALAPIGGRKAIEWVCFTSTDMRY